jgi:hypothetical protein
MVRSLGGIRVYCRPVDRYHAIPETRGAREGGAVLMESSEEALVASEASQWPGRVPLSTQGVRRRRPNVEKEP